MFLFQVFKGVVPVDQLCGVRGSVLAKSNSRSCQPFFADDALSARPAVLSKAARTQEITVSAREADEKRLQAIAALRTPRTLDDNGTEIKCLDANDFPGELCSNRASVESESSDEAYTQVLDQCKTNIHTSLRNAHKASRTPSIKQASSDRPSAGETVVATRGQSRIDKAKEVQSRIDKVLASFDPKQVSVSQDPSKIPLVAERTASTESIFSSGRSSTVSIGSNAPTGFGAVHDIDERYERSRAAERIRDITEDMQRSGCALPQREQASLRRHDPRSSWSGHDKTRTGWVTVGDEVRDYRLLMEGKFRRLGFKERPMESAERDPARAVKQVIEKYHVNSLAIYQYFPGFSDDPHDLPGEKKMEIDHYISELRAQRVNCSGPTQVEDRERACVAA